MSTSMPNGVIIYEGPSFIDDKPIVAIITGLRNSSKNTKTGAMKQLYILRSDIPPIEAIKSNQDYSICGDCKHRGMFGAGRSCYVLVHQAPTNIYKTYKAGKYKKLRIDQLFTGEYATLFSGIELRLGAYGDTAAIPLGITQSLAILTKRRNKFKFTNYTHQWDTNNGCKLQRYAMASVDNLAEKKKANRAGWKTFRIKTAEESIEKDEVECPAAKHPGKYTCSTCLLCNGRKANVVVTVHGSKGKIDAFNTNQNK